MKLKHILILLALLLPAALLFAQSEGEVEDETYQLKTEDIDVVKPYIPTIADAVKENMQPQSEDIEYETKPLNYDLPNKLLELPYKPPNLKPLAMKREKIKPPYTTYFKAGYGNLSTTLLEARYSDGNIRKKYFYSAYYKHLASKGSLENQAFDDNELGVHGKYYRKKTILNGGISYKRNGLHFYGYDSDTSFTKSESRQTFSDLHTNFNVSNIPTKKKKATYMIDLDHHYFTSKNGENENMFDFTPSLNQIFKSGNILHLQVETQLSNYSNTTSNNNSLVKFNQSYFFAKYGVKLGLNQTIENSNFYIFPDIGFEKELVPSYLILYNGWKRWADQTTYRKLALENPYVNTNLEIKNTIIEDRFVGIKGNLTSKISYNVKFSQKIIKDMPLYLNDSLDERKFNVIYDDATVINLRSEFTYGISEKLRILAMAEYWGYEMENVTQAFHLPSLRTTLSAEYHIAQNLYSSASIYAQDNVFYNDSEKLKGFVDINLALAYKFSTNLSFFINLNNLAGTHYEKWRKYPSYGFNGLVGLTVTF
ncbi:MAG: hypothetical protein IH946_07350 [Bacteroidetes bacterium]|nr:hypothetical protein [Bacteroidota bacterium]